MILTERLCLRPFEAQDLPAFAAYRGDPEVARYQSWDSNCSKADAEALLASQEGLAFGATEEWLQLAAVDRMSGELCGDCAVRLRDRNAELGITLASAHQSRGLATETLTAVIKRLFLEHDVHRVYAETDDRNTGVHRLFERLGFRCEARLLEADSFREEWATVRIHAILRCEWTRT